MMLNLLESINIRNNIISEKDIEYNKAVDKLNEILADQGKE